MVRPAHGALVPIAWPAIRKRPGWGEAARDTAAVFPAHAQRVSALPRPNHPQHYCCEEGERTRRRESDIRVSGMGLMLACGTHYDATRVPLSVRLFNRAREINGPREKERAGTWLTPCLMPIAARSYPAYPIRTVDAARMTDKMATAHGWGFMQCWGFMHRCCLSHAPSPNIPSPRVPPG
jgi:hypothetical protein